MGRPIDAEMAVREVCGAIGKRALTHIIPERPTSRSNRGGRRLLAWHH
jgi:hypothetical protein